MVKIQDNREIISIELPNKVVQLVLTAFDTDIDTDDLLKVQYHNIYGELVSISRLLNRVGNLKAEMEELLSQAKLDFDIFYAQMQEEKRKGLTFIEEGSQKVKNPTVSEVEAAIVRTPQYKVKKQSIFKVQKNMEYINSLHEAVKNKSFVIMKISDKLKPESFENEIVEGSVNGVMIKLRPKLIK